MARREYFPYFLIGSSHETSSLNFISFMKCVWMYFRMFITTVCVLFLLKLRWPKNKSIYHQSGHWSSYSHLLVRQISVIPQIILKHFDSFISFHSFIVQSCVDNEPQSPPDLKKVNKRYHHHHHHHHHHFLKFFLYCKIPSLWLFSFYSITLTSSKLSGFSFFSMEDKCLPTLQSMCLKQTYIGPIIQCPA